MASTTFVARRPVMQDEPVSPALEQRLSALAALDAVELGVLSLADAVTLYRTSPAAVERVRQERAPYSSAA